MMGRLCLLSLDSVLCVVSRILVTTSTSLCYVHKRGAKAIWNDPHSKYLCYCLCVHLCSTINTVIVKPSIRLVLLASRECFNALLQIKRGKCTLQPLIDPIFSMQVYTKYSSTQSPLFYNAIFNLPTTDSSKTSGRGNTHNPSGGDPFLKGNLSRARGSIIGESDFFLRCVLSLSLSREGRSLSFSLLFRRSPCFSWWWDLLLLRRLSERSFSRWRSRSWWSDRLLLRRRSRDRLRCLLFLVILFLIIF